MSIYAISDLHLSLSPNIDKPMDIYGGAWINHVEKIRCNWTEKIKEDDTVIIPGDVSWALKLDDAKADLNWIEELPGKKVIIKGNHDLWWSSITKMNGMFETITFLQNDFYEAEGCAICGSRGWSCPGSEGFEASDEKIYKRELLRLEASLKAAKEKGFENIIGALHYPPTNEKKQLSEFNGLFEKYNVKKVIYGHLHGADAVKNREAVNYNGVSYKLVSVDALDCMPIQIK